MPCACKVARTIRADGFMRKEGGPWKAWIGRGRDPSIPPTRRKGPAAVPGATTGTPRVASQTKQNKTKHSADMACGACNAPTQDGANVRHMDFRSDMVTIITFKSPWPYHWCRRPRVADRARSKIFAGEHHAKIETPPRRTATTSRLARLGMWLRRSEVSPVA